ncbi:MAG: AAA family ATPase [Clostridia bacterium]|nr:AAA family ATPase [Clostridia bacterium]MDY5554882.1 AAA family ATPase [Blautia sp.]
MGIYEFKESDAWNFARGSGIETKQKGYELQFLTCPYCRGGRSADKGTFSINLTTGQFKCLRSSCSVSGNMITLARDFDPAVDKGKEWCEPNCKPILFGMYQCNLDNKTLILTEGQIDSLSVSEAGMENAVSVPTGKNGFTWIPYCWDWLQNFNTLIVFGDNENGHITLLDDMKRRFRGTVKAVRQQDYRGCKDANEILQKYGRDAVRDAVEHAEAVPVQAVEDLSDVKSVDLFSLPKIPTGIRSLDRILSGGIYLGQTVILTGKRGDGKSTFASQLLANALNDGKTILAYSGELPDYFFKRWIDFQIAGRLNVIDRAGESGSVNYYIPKEKTERISEWYRGRAFLYDNRSAGDDEPGDLLETIEKAIQQYGVQLVLLDNLMTALDVGMNVDLYRAQSQFVGRLVKMAKRQQVAVILVVHPRKNKYGSDNTDDFTRPFGWEADGDGFLPVTEEQMEQMEIPFE